MFDLNHTQQQSLFTVKPIKARMLENRQVSECAEAAGNCLYTCMYDVNADYKCKSSGHKEKSSWYLYGEMT